MRGGIDVVRNSIGVGVGITRASSAHLKGLPDEPVLSRVVVGESGAGAARCREHEEHSGALECCSDVRRVLLSHLAAAHLDDEPPPKPKRPIP